MTTCFDYNGERNTCEKISEYGYYRWLKSKNKPTAKELLSVEIQAILEEYPDNDNYGVNRTA